MSATKRDRYACRRQSLKNKFSKLKATAVSDSDSDMNAQRHSGTQISITDSQASNQASENGIRQTDERRASTAAPIIDALLALWRQPVCQH